MAGVIGQFLAFIGHVAPSVEGLMARLTPEQKQALTTQAHQFVDWTGQMKDASTARVGRLKSSMVNHPAVYTPVAGVGAGTIVTVLKNLEATCSKNVDDDCYWQIGTVSLYFLFFVLLCGTVYLRNRNATKTQESEGHVTLLDALKEKSEFFKTAKALAEHALVSDNPLESLRQLESTYFQGDRDRSVPSTLASHWGRAKHLASKPDTFDELVRCIETEVLPLIKYYLDDLEPMIQRAQRATGGPTQPSSLPPVQMASQPDIIVPIRDDVDD